jgi:trigger factor
MNITQEITGDLSATIKIEVNPDDYQTQVNNSLKDLQKKASLKGFRPGKVPFGLIKKMYEKGAVAEEVNKLLSDSLNNYITENKLDILGYPLANEEKNKKIDFENSTHYEFFFDIGFTPSFSLDISENFTADYYDLIVEDKIIDNYVDETRRRFGKLTQPETIEKGDLIRGEILQLNESGLELEGGIKKHTTLLLDQIKDEKVRQEFMGKKIGDKIRFNPLKATGNIIEAATMLGIKQEDAEKSDSEIEFTINEISRIEPAAIDAELFNQVYPGGGIQNVNQFREKLAGEAKTYYQTESENYFVHTTLEKLIHDTEFILPDQFIKRWLVDSDQKLTPEMVEKDYQGYVKSLRQQLIINKIAKDNDIKIGEQEIKDHIKNFLLRQYMFDASDEDKIKHLESVVESVLKNKEETAKISDQLFDAKLKELFKSKLKLDKKAVTYEEFIKIVNEHHKIHHHEHE